MEIESPPSQNRRKRRTRGGVTAYLIYAFIACAVLLPLTGVGLFFYYSTHLPDFQPLKEKNLNAYSIVYSEEDEVVGKFLVENKIPMPYERIMASGGRFLPKRDHNIRMEKLKLLGKLIRL